MAMDPIRLVWTVRATFYSKEFAKKHAKALEEPKPPQQPLRTRIIVLNRQTREPIKPFINNPARAWRDAQAGKLLDLADARKRYKSPG